MTIQEYEALTGQTVTDTALVEAMIARATSRLESVLGYSLDLTKNIYSELGKVQYNYLINTLPVPADVLDNLAPADVPQGDLRIFPLELRDKHVLVQPFDEAYRAKIAIAISDDTFITLADLDSAIPQYTGLGFGRWIEIDMPHDIDPGLIYRHTSWYSGRSRRPRLVLALDAKYTDLTDVDDIKYLLCDLVDYYSDPNNGAAMGNIKSESVDGHSWSKGEEILSPDDTDLHKKTVSLYVGPYGKRARVNVR